MDLRKNDVPIRKLPPKIWSRCQSIVQSIVQSTSAVQSPAFTVTPVCCTRDLTVPAIVLRDMHLCKGMNVSLYVGRELISDVLNAIFVRRSCHPF